MCLEQVSSRRRVQKLFTVQRTRGASNCADEFDGVDKTVVVRVEQLEEGRRALPNNTARRISGIERGVTIEQELRIRMFREKAVHVLYDGINTLEVVLKNRNMLGAGTHTRVLFSFEIK